MTQPCWQRRGFFSIRSTALGLANVDQLRLAHRNLAKQSEGDLRDPVMNALESVAANGAVVLIGEERMAEKDGA